MPEKQEIAELQKDYRAGEKETEAKKTMSEIQKETDGIMETAGYINMPAGTLYYKTYGKKCDTQEKTDFRWYSFMGTGALTGIFYTVHMEDAPVTHVMILI